MYKCKYIYIYMYLSMFLHMYVCFSKGDCADVIQQRCETWGIARNAVFFHSFVASERLEINEILKNWKPEPTSGRPGRPCSSGTTTGLLKGPRTFRNCRILRNGDKRGPTLSCNGTQQGPTRRCPLSYVVLRQGTTGDCQVEPWKIFGRAFAKVTTGPQRGTR